MPQETLKAKWVVVGVSRVHVVHVLVGEASRKLGSRHVRISWKRTVGTPLVMRMLGADFFIVPLAKGQSRQSGKSVLSQLMHVRLIG